MPIFIGLASLVLLALVLGPQAWVRQVLARHGVERRDLPGTGGELARHLLDETGLHGVKVAPPAAILDQKNRFGGRGRPRFSRRVLPA
jgi:Zn-dependent membrane protease YugP